MFYFIDIYKFEKYNIINNKIILFYFFHNKINLILLFKNMYINKS